MKWKCNLNMLKDIKLRRCYKPEGFGQVVSCSLHHFYDASENGWTSDICETSKCNWKDPLQFGYSQITCYTN